MEREALKLALEALELHLAHHEHGCVYLDPAVTAIKEALAQPAPQREWVDLSDSQIEQVYFDFVKLHRGAAMPWAQVQFGRALQALIKEKNT